MTTQVITELENLRRKLLDTGTRNRLIHVNRANQKSNSLNIINEISDSVYSILRHDEKRMRFKAMGKDRLSAEDVVVFAEPDPSATSNSERLTDQWLETPLGPEALVRRLLRLANDARTAEEEQGINILYLALGFLAWKEDGSSEIKREAPLILLPVELKRNPKTSAYELHSRDDDLSTNLSLAEKLREDFGINLPDLEESEEWQPSQYFAQVSDSISAKADWTIDENGMQLGFFSFAKLLMHRDLETNGWPNNSLIEHPLISGLLRDGFPHSEPSAQEIQKLDEIFHPSDIIQIIDADASQTKVIEEVRGTHKPSLVVQGPPGTGKSQTIANLIAAAVHDGKKVLFVAEKATALSVVHQRLVNAGLRDLCIELHSRNVSKKVLAQELGRTLNAAAQVLPYPNEPDELCRKRDQLNKIAHLLHRPIGQAIETPFYTMSELISFIGQGIKPPNLPQEGLEHLDRTGRMAILKSIKSYVSARSIIGNPLDHPFYGITDISLQPPDRERALITLQSLIGEFEKLSAQSAQITAIVEQEKPDTLADIDHLSNLLMLFEVRPSKVSEFLNEIFEYVDDPRLKDGLDIGRDWASAYRLAEVSFNEAAWIADIARIREEIVFKINSFWHRLFGSFFRSSSEFATLLKGLLPSSLPAQLELLDQLIDVKRKRKKLADEEPWLKPIIAKYWREERTPFNDILAVANWTQDIKAVTKSSEPNTILIWLKIFDEPAKLSNELRQKSKRILTLVEELIGQLKIDQSEFGLTPGLEKVSLVTLYNRIYNLHQNWDKYSDWVSYKRAVLVLLANEGHSIIPAVEQGVLSPFQADISFAYACAEARWRYIRASHPDFLEVESYDRHELVDQFKTLERQRLKDVSNIIRMRHYSQVPRGGDGPMGLIRGEIGRKRGHKPIRWLMKHAGSMVQRIKPVMLMSPLSVAQFLPVGDAKFDLLIMDEASQIRPEDAIGVIARAGQIVVVGDPKQLPPTSFFDRAVQDNSDDDEDEDDDESGQPVKIIGMKAVESESILSLCTARVLPQRMLKWHYRSRDPSLIRVSNAEFYEDELVLPPSPLQRDEQYGLMLRRVAGIYAKGSSGLGRKGTNKIEAEAVVKAVAKHAREWPEYSLGIVAFSKAQSDMLTEILERERRQDPVLDSFLRELPDQENVFVKNIENVQGDERDVILISIGYGPLEPNGRLSSMNFGPVNREGGERRLNVLFTRARMRCEIFASFDPGEIDLKRTTGDGPRILKRFLDFAQSGIFDEKIDTGGNADSPFEEDVAAVIRRLGYEVDLQVGSGGFRIDLGVRHPDRPSQYIIAVECDGAAYHSALWARERDRLRQEILENLGWRFHRIWSTDWFHRRAREIERLQIALEEARKAIRDGIVVRGANNNGVIVVRDEKVENSDDSDYPSLPLDNKQNQIFAPPYERAKIEIISKLEPHEVSSKELAKLVVQIIAYEGPIHIAEVARRVSSAYGKLKAGNRIVDATNRAINYALQNEMGELLLSGDFLMTAEQGKNPPVRDRSNETGGVINAEYLPPVEINAAIELIIRESGEMDDQSMVRAIAKLFGFKRVGPDLYEVISAAVNRLRQ